MTASKEETQNKVTGDGTREKDLDGKSHRNSNSNSEEDEKPDELPSVEDRSLFLGCLTLVVKSAYDFDLTVEGAARDKSKENGNYNDNEPQETPEKTNNRERLLQTEQASLYNLDDFNDSDNKDGLTSIRSTSTDENSEDPQYSEAELQARKAQREERIRQKLKQAHERHLVRRYRVAHDFIVRSAQHLLLDEKSALLHKELLSQLETLLEADSNSSSRPPSFSKATTSNATSSHIEDTLDHPEKEAIHQAKEQLPSSTSLQSLEWIQDNQDLQTYLTSLSNSEQKDAGFQCLGWLLFQHLLHDTKESGYDARIRYWFKTLAVTLWVFQQQQDENDSTKQFSSSKEHKQLLLQRATRKFESLEDCCAERLLTLAATDTKNKQRTNRINGSDSQQTPKRKSSMTNSIWKGVQIGGVGVGAGILLAVTGGLAAPGIAAGLAALGMGAVAGTFLTLASSAAVVSIFGVAGGSLAAYKMNRRVSGLTEFAFHQEWTDTDANRNLKNEDKKNRTPKSRLFRTIGISGWINDQSDFQRPWGVQPTDPPIQDPVELLQRFYAVHNPDLVPSAKYIWKRYRDQKDDLWSMLEKKYGCNPDLIFAKSSDNNENENTLCRLTDNEIKKLDHIIVAIGKVEGGERCDVDTPNVPPTTGKNPKGTVPKSSNFYEKDKKDKREGGAGVKNLFRGWSKKSNDEEAADDQKVDNRLRGGDSFDDEEDIPWKGWGDQAPSYRPKREPIRADTFENIDKVDIHEAFESPAHLTTVWSYPDRYGGELYTVRWESDLMKELSESVGNLAVELAAKTGQQVLKTTVAATLVFSAALPITVMQGMNAIDGTWTLVIERSDEAGKELARSLLINKGGHRPVTLVGYSFGARIIYSCLKALAVYQDKWEEFQLELAEKMRKSASSKNKSSGEGNKKEKKTMCVVDDVEFDREPASIVEDVIIMGLPKFINLAAWARLRQIVGGRLVNVYSRADTVLSYMFRYKQLLGSLKFLPVAGNATVAVPGVESIDVTDLVAHHHEYSIKIGPILERVRHGEPVRASARVVDEVALLQKAKDAADEGDANN